MSNYWLMLVVCGAVGCSGVSAEPSGGSNQEAVSDGSSGKDASDAGAPGKDDGSKGDDSKPPGDCDKALDAISAELAAATDPRIISDLKEKYAVVLKGCGAGDGPSNDDCKLQLAEAEKYLNVAAESGDDVQIRAAKEKYGIIAKTCSPQINPCKKPGKPGDDKADGGKPGDDKADGGKPGDGKADGGKPADDKAGDDKPGDDKADGNKPRGDKPDGGKADDKAGPAKPGDPHPCQPVPSTGEEPDKAGGKPDQGDGKPASEGDVPPVK